MPIGRTPQVASVAEDGLATRSGPDPAIVTNARVLEFHHYWLARRGSRRFPRRADIEPTDIPHLLSGIVLLDVHYDPLDFEYRLIGGDVQKRSGNLKGKRVRQASLLNTCSPAYRNYCAVVESGVPQFLEGAALGAYRPGRPTLVSRVHCPLSDDGEQINKLISYLAFLDPGQSVPGPAAAPRDR
jgi:hypothetical protein